MEVTLRHYYGIAALPVGSRLAPEDSMTVVAFASRRERDAWVDWPGEAEAPTHRYLQTHGERRRAASREEAEETLASITGGRDPHALSHLAAWPADADEFDEAKEIRRHYGL